MEEKNVVYVLWVDLGDGWFAHSRYSLEKEADRASEQFDYSGCYCYIEEEEE